MTSTRSWCRVGAGAAFCAGYDIGLFGEGSAEHPCKQEAGPWDPMLDYRYMRACTDDFMSLWHSPKPTIARVRKYAIAGGSDIALWCDLRVMETSAYFGVYCRRWGVPLIDGGTVRLPRLVGQGRALDIILTGRKVPGGGSCGERRVRTGGAGRHGARGG